MSEEKQNVAKVYAYENSKGDKGIIIANSLDDASELFKKEYPKRKIVDTSKDVLDQNEAYWDNGAYVFEMGEVSNNKLYCCFPW